MTFVNSASFEKSWLSANDFRAADKLNSTGTDLWLKCVECWLIATIYYVFQHSDVRRHLISEILDWRIRSAKKTQGFIGEMAHRNE